AVGKERRPGRPALADARAALMLIVVVLRPVDPEGLAPRRAAPHLAGEALDHRAADIRRLAVLALDDRVILRVRPFQHADRVLARSVTVRVRPGRIAAG